MKFHLLDKVEHVTDERIVAVKVVSLAEEYLGDHFPTFPVLPGVMMLEAMTQAAGWLLHRSSGFACSMAVLSEARNVKYGHFVSPGRLLRVDVVRQKLTQRGATFKASATVSDGAAVDTDPQAVSARLELAYFNLADTRADLLEVDEKLRRGHRQRWAVLNAQSPELTHSALPRS